jgi:CubicO group peptidase (beta-lactamase class C family)
MYQLDSKSEKLIGKMIKGRKFIKLNVGLIIGDQIILKTFNENGEIDYENNIYEIGSITKTFTASLLSKYIHENKMKLDDSLQKYISELDLDRHYPSLRHLATHTAGYKANSITTRESLELLKDTVIGYGNTCLKNPLNMDFNEMVGIIQNYHLKNKDYKWKYSNIGFSFLGYALGAASGYGYHNIMEDFIKNELELKNTFLGTINGKNLKGFNSKNEDCGNWKWENNLYAPAGAISSTTDDLLEYAKSNMHEEKPYFALCHQKHASISKNFDMGLGWMQTLFRKSNNRILWHSGGTGCFLTFMGFNKEKKIASVVLSNYKLFSVQRLGLLILENIKI